MRVDGSANPTMPKNPAQYSIRLYGHIRGVWTLSGVAHKALTGRQGLCALRAAASSSTARAPRCRTGGSTASVEPYDDIPFPECGRELRDKSLTQHTGHTPAFPDSSIVDVLGLAHMRGSGFRFVSDVRFQFPLPYEIFALSFLHT